MTVAGTSTRATPWLVSNDVQTALAALDDVLRGAIDTQDNELAKIALRLVALPGKRIRPALVLLVGEITSADLDAEPWLRLAAGVELLHIGALYHDDIMDRAALRRGERSANIEWGSALAAVAGTYVTARGVELLLPAGPLLPLVSEALLALCTGQLREAQNTYKLDVPLPDYVDVVAKKTASLFELPCVLGAKVADAPPDQLAAVARYGRHLGVAFQIADDALDLTGDSREMGKLTGNDIREGAYSMPILLAAQVGDATAQQLRELLQKERLESEEVDAVVTLLKESDAPAAALRIAEGHRDQAIAALERVPGGAARESMANLAEYATSRSR